MRVTTEDRYSQKYLSSVVTLIHKVYIEYIYTFAVDSSKYMECFLLLSVQSGIAELV